MGKVHQGAHAVIDKSFFRWLKWLKDDKPAITHLGYHCGCCGKWIAEPITIPTYKSLGALWDTVGLCPVGTGCDINTGSEASEWPVTIITHNLDR